MTMGNLSLLFLSPRRAFSSRRFCAALAAAALAAPPFAAAQTVLSPLGSPPLKNPLGLTLSVTADQAANPVHFHIVLKNPSQEIACVGDNTFSPLDNGVLFRNMADKLVDPTDEVYRRPQDVRGVDVSQKYFFVFPGRSIDVDAIVKNYTLKPGSYKYEWFVSHYACDDILGLEKPPATSRPDMYVLRQTGRINVSGAH